MKTKVGIVGYGNLGKSVENDLFFNKKFKLIAIFSKRNIKSNLGTKVENVQNINKYIGKIDTLFLCGGSKNDIEEIIFDLAKNFNTINCFDTHKNIFKISQKLQEICVQNKTISIMSCGWDPGIFSLIRTLAFSLGDTHPVTFWGKGISMGHSDAVRQIKHVNDAVQFTVPNKQALEEYKMNKSISQATPRHKRICYVCANKKYHSIIEKQIKEMPNYFMGQPTTIYFTSKNRVEKLKQNLSHQGTIYSNISLSNGENCSLSFSLKMSSNAYLTARIMTTYCLAISKFTHENKFGCYNILDIPPSSLFIKKQLEYATKMLL